MSRTDFRHNEIRVMKSLNFILLDQPENDVSQCYITETVLHHNTMYISQSSFQISVIYFSTVENIVQLFTFTRYM